ncbi:hypothetical protein ACTOWA_05695 [Herbaspirillum seropedicae]|uniref:hypothetical protein n=1 Tax=Herbaspirillum seropedicae TaxID=964 RepID=UPI003F8D6F52
MVRIKIIHLRCHATKSTTRKPLPRLDYSREAAILSCCTSASQHHSGGTSKKLSRLLVLPLDQTNLTAIDSQPIIQVTSHQRALLPSGTGQAAGQNGTAQTQPRQTLPAASGNGDIALTYAATSANRRTPLGWARNAAAMAAGSVRARRALHRASSFGSLLAFLLIDFSRYFFDQGDSHPVPARAPA